ncbi:energy-coupling factor ABC transporter permease [Pseudomonas sp. F1_0610]|uniref:energy-coupling factor ABC transporter permease n=1 Tax=Pseudomonas sp. F1_0610 TaxID=3114284 RepID=UPI0039C03749
MIDSSILSELTLTIGWAIYAPVLLWAIFNAPWVELFSDQRKQHLLFGTVFCLCLLWMIRKDFPSGISFHFIGMTAVTLLLNWPLAILAGLIAQLSLLVLGKQDFASFGLNAVLVTLIPVLIVHLCAEWVERLKPENLFVYIFCSGFFPAAITAIICSFTGLGLLWIDGIYAFPPWISEFIGMLLLVAFPEAFINGTVITALVVFKPEWLETFNRTRYLQAPWKDEKAD